MKRKAFSRRKGKKTNYTIISFSDSHSCLCLKSLDPNNARLCPYIEALINNDDFKNIDINDIQINDTEENEETETAKASAVITAHTKYY